MNQNQLVKSSLSGHAALGLTAAVFLYLICLTGTLIVFAAQLARWEQPNIVESDTVTPALVAKTLANYIETAKPSPDQSVFINFPSEEMPRFSLRSNGQSYFVNADASLGESPEHEWTEFIEELHTTLHLPHEIGTIFVSIFAVILMALIVSGLLAHPRIFKDAFRLRLGGNPRLQFADIHNRLGIWALPFHLMIAVTGSVFGLVSILALVAAPVYYDGDRGAIIDDVYGSDPVVTAPLQPLQVGKVLEYIEKTHPDATPFYLVAHKVGTENQFMEFGAILPGRLVFSELYRFNADGSFINSQELSSGPVGRQVMYSIYRLHFGQFGGLWVRFAYFFLGLSLTVIAATGVSIWLKRRGGHNWVNDMWCAVVWGAPAAMLTALLAVFAGMPALLVFIVSQFLLLVYALRMQDKQQLRAQLQRLNAGLIAMALLVYGVIHVASLLQPIVLAVNVSAFAIALLMLLMAGQSKVTHLE